MQCAALAPNGLSLSLRAMIRPLPSKSARPIAKAASGQVNYSEEFSPPCRSS